MKQLEDPILRRFYDEKQQSALTMLGLLSLLSLLASLYFKSWVPLELIAIFGIVILVMLLSLYLRLSEGIGRLTWRERDAFDRWLQKNGGVKIDSISLS